VQHANHLARYELARGRFLRLVQPDAQAATPDATQGQLQVAHQAPDVVAQLLRGIRGATQGLRHMLTLRHDGEALSVACVPLFQPFEGEAASVLVMLGRQSATPNLALTFFARDHRLSQAEENVLRALCKGQEIPDIAVAHSVAESTIRTQIRSLREKTQCHSIRVLVQQVAALPPVVPVSLTVQNLMTRTARYWQTPE
jgi:DNA-binding CsgD family transcriptional regulator